tara:strand:- start:504 stop:1331 length:828 start_codon:yes stop_codon:yes gene_type:complete
MAAATAIAAAGLAISIGTTAASFSQASKQKKAQKRAERDAEKAMQEARGKLDVNFAEQMSVKKEAYDLEREAMNVAGAQATEAGKESERGSAATAGRVYAQQQQGQAGIRGAMADEMTNIEQQIVDEDSRLRDLDVALDLEEVAGNQQRAADAQQAAELAKQQGIQGIANVAQQAAAFVPLYSQNIGAQKTAVGASVGDSSLGDTMAGTVGGGRFEGQTLGQIDFQNISNRDFRNIKRNLTPAQQQGIFQSQAYVQNYQNPFNVYLPNAASAVQQ